MATAQKCMRKTIDFINSLRGDSREMRYLNTQKVQACKGLEIQDTKTRKNKKTAGNGISPVPSTKTCGKV